MKKLLTLLLFFSWTFCSLSWGLDVPTLTGPVVDHARFLSENGSKIIANALYDLEREKGIQFQVLVISKLENETLEGYSIRVVDNWKIGKKGDDRAALFLIAAEDRKMRIEVGRGLEGDLTDLTSRRIIEEVKPLFRKGDNDNGVALGLSLMARSAGVDLKFNGKVTPKHSRKKVSSSFLLLILFLLIAFLQYVFPGGGGYRRRGYGGWYGGGGGFGGGGGWSGGGGGFSGGGSSGSW